MRHTTLMKSAGVLLLVTALAIPLLAGPFGHRMRGPKQGMERRFEKLAEELKLSKEQTAKMSEARDALQLNMINLRADLARQQLELRTALRAEKNTPEQKVAELFQKEADLKAKIAFERYRHRMSIRSMLTPEQQKKMESLMSKRHEKMRGRMHGGRMMHDGQLDDDEAGDRGEATPRRRKI